MKRYKRIIYTILIFLPATLITAVGAYLVFTFVPSAIKNAPRRISLEYRTYAENLAENPAAATYIGERKRGWRQIGKIDGRSWGIDKDDGNKLAVVWLKMADDEYRAIETTRLKAFPYEIVFYGGGLLVAIILFWLSAIAAEYFHKFIRERDDFLAAVAHDLTTPLLGMRLIIGRDEMEAKRLTERMLVIVNNLKEFLRLDGQKAKPKRERIDLEALAHEAYTLFSADYEAEESGAVEFDNSGLGGKALMALGDEGMTLQILWNLFGNDLKYAAPFGKVRVKFLAAEKGRVGVEFIDDGPGMSLLARHRAFDRYYRAQTVLASGKGGFGIGLCNAREHAIAMGGMLSLRKNRPHGCVFTLKLPIAS